MKKLNLVLVGALCVGGFSLWNNSATAEDGAQGEANVSQMVAEAFGATDVAFDQYVDLAVVAHAWDSLNSELLTDVALQMLEGERILRRPHRIIAGDELLQTAVKVSVDKRDLVSLERLAQVANDTGRTRMADKIAQSQKLMAASRGDQPSSVVSVQSTSADQFEAHQAVLAEIQRAKLTGDNDSLNAIEKDLTSATMLTEQQRQDLSNQIATTRTSMAQPSADDTATRETLEKLSGASRQWNTGWGWGGGYWPYYPQHTSTWYRNPYNPASNIAIPGTNRYFSRYVPGVGWVSGNRYIGLDGRPHGRTTASNPWGGSSTTFYYKKK